MDTKMLILNNSPPKLDTKKTVSWHFICHSSSLRFGRPSPFKAWIVQINARGLTLFQHARKDGIMYYAAISYVFAAFSHPL